jgi:catechol 2,3-dioxygenase-like lactoylglutathione lyase family enzyme
MVNARPKAGWADRTIESGAAGGPSDRQVPGTGFRLPGRRTIGGREFFGAGTRRRLSSGSALPRTMESRISVITLGVKDLPTSVEFYRRVVGWKSRFKMGDPIAFFPLNGVVLSLYPRTALAADAEVTAGGTGFHGLTFSHNVRSQRAVDAAFRTLRQRGAHIVKEPRRADWGGHSGYFADPDGHLWEIAFNPMWKLDRRGAVVLRG